ncbi:MAG: hypothetical protein ACRCYE_05225 [Sarcina sp.]
MKRVAIGLIFLFTLSVTVGAIAQQQLTSVNRNVCTSEKKDFSINQLKFIDTKLEKVNGQDVIKTKIENTSSFPIIGIDYKYELNNKIFNIEYNKEIQSGKSSADLNVYVNEINFKQKANLLNANISLLNESGKIETIEYLRGV